MGCVFIGFRIQPEDQIGTVIKHDFRQGPLGDITQIITEVQPGQVDTSRASVVDFQPGLIITRMILNGLRVSDHDLVKAYITVIGIAVQGLI